MIVGRQISINDKAAGPMGTKCTTEMCALQTTGTASTAVLKAILDEYVGNSQNLKHVTYRRWSVLQKHTEGGADSTPMMEIRKPSRNESDHTFRRRWDREKRASDRRSDSDLTKKQTPTTPLTQKHAGMNYCNLPIRSTH